MTTNCAFGERETVYFLVRLIAAVAFVLATAASPVRAATVTATWDRNSEPDIAGYLLSYGTQSGVYTTQLDVGNVVSVPLTLAPGWYFVAVRAYNTSGLISPYS